MDRFCASCHSLVHLHYIIGMFVVEVTRIMKFETNALKFF